MPRRQTRKQLLNFVGGLNTEASPLSFPEGTAKTLDNVDLNRDGSIKRRLGLDYELNGTYSEAAFDESVLKTYGISFHEWESVNGDDTLNFAVIQVGGTLYFHRAGDTSISTGAIGKIDLTPIRTREDFATYPVSTDFGKGNLFVVSPAISPVYITYNADANTFEGVKLTLKIRDIDGLDESTDSPLVFGDDITPDPGPDPEQDFQDVLDTLQDVILGAQNINIGVGF